MVLQLLLLQQEAEADRLFHLSLHQVRRGSAGGGPCTRAHLLWAWLGLGGGQEVAMGATGCALCLPSGSMYPRPEAGNELDMDLSEDDAEEAAGACEAEGSSLEEDRSVGFQGRRSAGASAHRGGGGLPLHPVWGTRVLALGGQPLPAVGRQRAPPPATPFWLSPQEAGGLHVTLRATRLPHIVPPSQPSLPAVALLRPLPAACSPGAAGRSASPPLLLQAPGTEPWPHGKRSAAPAPPDWDRSLPLEHWWWSRLCAWPQDVCARLSLWAGPGLASPPPHARPAESRIRLGSPGSDGAVLPTPTCDVGRFF